MATENNLKCAQYAEELPEQLHELLEKSQWDTLFKTKSGDTIKVAQSQSWNWNKRRIILISGVVDANIKQVLRAIFDDVQQLPQWNPGVLECKILNNINSTTDVIHQLTNGITGIISPREFVVIRRLTNSPQEAYTLAMKSVTLADYPNISGVVRGEYGLGGWLLSEGNNDGQTEYRWIVDMDINVSNLVPRRMIERYLIKALVQAVDGLKVYLSRV